MTESAHNLPTWICETRASASDDSWMYSDRSGFFFIKMSYLRFHAIFFFKSKCVSRSFSSSRLPQKLLFFLFDAELNSTYGKNKERPNEFTDFEKSRKQTPKVTSRSEIFRSQTSSATHPYYSISYCRCTGKALRVIYQSGAAKLARVSQMTSGCIVADQNFPHRNDS